MSPDRAEGAGERKKIHPATEAALWALSSGRCYAPGCTMPVVFEVRPGVYRKNAQVAHIYGVRGARYRPDLPATVRDSFYNLLLLCHPHHDEVDDDEKRYPSELLRQWKESHDGPEVAALSGATISDPDKFMDLLAKLAKPPLDRLESITERLEKTGEATEENVRELRYLVDLLSSPDISPDRRSALALAEAAEIFSAESLGRSASNLMNAAEVLPDVVHRIEQAARRLGEFG
ncbi:hypothetical protein EV137_0146 [Kribbella pratensis]|uniref:HNH endonuclease n=2 Tax=Kribbella pratensis TaxID=2512112 RepID=A0ABY2FJC2_9ACTN|nr:hypothetical protein EV137_0146 [Kribbella pratensis]